MEILALKWTRILGVLKYMSVKYVRGRARVDKTTPLRHFRVKSAFI